MVDKRSTADRPRTSGRADSEAASRSSHEGDVREELSMRYGSSARRLSMDERSEARNGTEGLHRSETSRKTTTLGRGMMLRPTLALCATVQRNAM